MPKPKKPRQGTVFQPSTHADRVQVIFCCGCDREIKAELRTGRDIYPHLRHLWSLPFWVCLACENYVGCHHKTKNRTRPLGCIPTPEIRAARQGIHQIIDPLWKNRVGGFSRGGLYAELSERLGYPFHSAEVRSVEEAEKIKSLARQIAKEGRKHGLTP